MPEQEFHALLGGELAKQSEEIRVKEEEKERQRFFNQPTAFADFDHWSRAAHWTLEGAVALSFGGNPEVVNSKALRLHKGTSAFAAQYSRLLDLARRAEVWQKLFDPVRRPPRGREDRRGVRAAGRPEGRRDLAHARLGQEPLDGVLCRAACSTPNSKTRQSW